MESLGDFARFFQRVGHSVPRDDSWFKRMAISESRGGAISWF